MSDDLVERLVSLADCDARAGEPLGKCMREAAAHIEELEAKLAKALTALGEVREFVKDLAPYAEQGHSLVPALQKACTVYAELTGGPGMSAPERIWINKVYGQHPEDWDFSTGDHLTKKQLRTKVEYRRADLPPTDAEVMKHPKVKAMVEALRDLIDHTHNCEKELTEKLHGADFCGESLPLTNARAALKGAEHDG